MYNILLILGWNVTRTCSWQVFPVESIDIILDRELGNFDAVKACLFPDLEAGPTWLKRLENTSTSLSFFTASWKWEKTDWIWSRILSCWFHSITWWPPQLCVLYLYPWKSDLLHVYPSHLPWPRNGGGSCLACWLWCRPIWVKRKSWIQQHSQHNHPKSTRDLRLNSHLEMCVD